LGCKNNVGTVNMYKWFTGDLHLNHQSKKEPKRNIVDFCDRPFADIEENNVVLIDNINAVVKPADLLYMLGDFSFCHPQIFLEKIMCNNIYIIFGNHDQWLKFYRDHKKVKKAEYFLVIKIGNILTSLFHYAMRVWPHSNYNAWHLYGHSHGELPPLGKSYDVGVDNNGYKPVHEDTIKQIMSKLPDNPGYEERRKRGKPEE
jgi:calcineurin-like phosphoesterase family protein